MPATRRTSPSSTVFALIGAAVALAASPGSASASTVAVRSLHASYDVFDAVEYRAAPGERNDVTLRFEHRDADTWTISDSGAVIVAEPPCRTSDEHTVTCTALPGRELGLAQLDLGDADDVLHWRGGGYLVADGGDGNDELVGGGRLEGGPGDDELAVDREVFLDVTVLDGGPGDDRLTGGEGNDELDGGGGRDTLLGGPGDDAMSDGDRDGAAGDAAPGPDFFDGGDETASTFPGGDVVSYRGRRVPVAVDLGHPGADGEPGEGDVLVRVEAVHGGAANDRLAGGRGNDVLAGGNGRDVLVGRRGNDALVPGRGGGPVSCGRGLDTVMPSGSTDVLAADCESVDFTSRGLFLAETLSARPHRSHGRLVYRVGCIEDDSDGESDYLYDRCRGAVRIREPSGARRLLAIGRFPAGHWAGRTVVLTPTALGRRLAAGQRKLVTMRLDLYDKAYLSKWSHTAVRWTVRVRLRL